MQQKILLSLLLLCSLLSIGQSLDTISVTLEQAEKIFLEKNALLLAQRYQVSAAKANEIQASLYNNPVFTAEFATYSDNKKWFDVGMKGQKSFAIDQLITLSDKRKLRMQVAKSETKEQEILFYDLLRTLRNELQQNFHQLIYARELIGKYDEQIALLTTIIKAYDDQVTRKNVSLKDAVRLKTEFIQLSADRNAIVMESIESLQTLRILLDTAAVILPQKEFLLNPLTFSDKELIEKAKEHRTDLQLQKNQQQQEQLNYSYQRALRVPDLNIGAGYDQNGSYLPNYYSLHTGIELPFFNRNKGNIKAARARLEAASLLSDYKEHSIEKEIEAILAKVREAEREYQTAQQNFSANFSEVNKAVIENFNKGNITILEFMDFFENYNAAIRQINLLQKQRRLTRVDLEYAVGTSIF